MSIFKCETLKISACAARPTFLTFDEARRIALNEEAPGPCSQGETPRLRVKAEGIDCLLQHRTKVDFFPLPRRFPPPREAIARNLRRCLAFGSCTGAASAPQKPARQCPGDAKGVTGLLSPERRKGGVGFGRRPPFFA